MIINELLKVDFVELKVDFAELKFGLRRAKGSQVIF